MSLALATLIYEWRRYMAAVIALAFSGLLILAQVGMFTGIVKGAPSRGGCAGRGSGAVASVTMRLARSGSRLRPPPSARPRHVTTTSCRAASSRSSI